MRAKHIECCFMFGLVWSVGSTGVEAGQRAFLEFLENIIADLGVIVTEWEGVNNALQVGGGSIVQETVHERIGPQRLRCKEIYVALQLILFSTQVMAHCLVHGQCS